MKNGSNNDSDNSKELNDLEAILSAICRDEFSKDKFTKLLFKNASFTSDLDKSAILFSSVFRFLEEFMIKCNYQITQGKEDKDSALMTNTFYFYKPD